MAEEKNYKIGIEIGATDTATPKVEQAGKAVETFEQRTRKLGKVGQNGMSAFGRKLDESRRKMDQAGGAADRMRRRLEGVSAFARRGADFMVRVKETGIARIRGLLGGLKNALFSLPALLGAGMGAAGAKSLILDPALEFEKQQISMLHWVGGNQKKATAATNWVQQFGASTPFTTEDIFPAFTRGLGIENGDIEKAKQLTVLAGDMAALTPGKTMRDAMEALADAKMGEFERLKEFNVKLTKSSAGGWGTIVKSLNTTFADGAKKLSESSGGLLSTIQDNLQIGLRSMGTGFWDGMKPTLQRIAGWFDKLPKDKDGTLVIFKNFEKWGKRAADTVLNVISAVRKWVADNQPLLHKLSATMGRLFDAAKPAIAWLIHEGFPQLIGFTATLLDKTANVVNWMADHWNQVKWAVYGVGGALMSLQIGAFASKVAESASGLLKVYQYLSKINGIGPIAISIALAVTVGTWIGNKIKKDIEDMYGQADKGLAGAAEMQDRMKEQLTKGYAVTGANPQAVRGAIRKERGLQGPIAESTMIGFEKQYLTEHFGYKFPQFVTRDPKQVAAEARQAEAHRRAQQRIPDEIKNSPLYGATNIMPGGMFDPIGPTPENLYGVPSSIVDATKGRPGGKPFTPPAAPASKPPIMVPPVKYPAPGPFTFDLFGSGKIIESHSRFHNAMTLEADRGGQQLYTTTAGWYQRLGDLRPPELSPLTAGGPVNIGPINITATGGNARDIARDLYTELSLRFANKPK